MAKRARERARQEKQAAKRARRQGGSADQSETTEEPEDAPDEGALMEEFRVLSERHAAGEVDQASYDEERHRIFVELGIETEDDG